MDAAQANKLKMAIFIAAVIILGLIGYAAITTLNQQGKVPVTISVVPADAEVVVNGVPMSAGETYLKPGGYEIKATKEGFADFSLSKEIDAVDNTIVVSMTPESEEAQQWVSENQDKYQENEAIGGEEAAETGEEFRTKNPIVNLLPHESLLYTIGYRADPADPSGESIIIEIDAGEPYRQQAIYQITQWGYDPTDFKIKFRDYKNPFAS